MEILRTREIRLTFMDEQIRAAVGDMAGSASTGRAQRSRLRRWILATFFWHCQSPHTSSVTLAVGIRRLPHPFFNA
jgi:hypothetical protein